MGKVKEIFKTLISKIKLIPKKSVIIAVISILLIALIITLVIINSNKITNLEEIKINEFSNEISNYIEEFENIDDEGKYINYAIEYLYNTENKTEYSIDEITNVINETFNVKYVQEDIMEIGISPKMLDKGVTYESASNTFKYNAQKTRVDIASTPIKKYELTKIKKVNKEKFVITYNKYVVENPYEMLNYYNNQNIENDKEYDTTDISEYLKGNRKISVIKKSIVSKDINNYGKADGSIELEFIIKDNKLVLNLS